MSSIFWPSIGWEVKFLTLILRFRLGQCSENQFDIVMARRRRPKLTQCTSEVMGMSEKRAWSRHMRALLHSKSLTMLRISWRSACRIIPRTFSKVETCFFLWGGRMQKGRKVDKCQRKLSLCGVVKGCHHFWATVIVSVSEDQFLVRHKNMISFSK